MVPVAHVHTWNRHPRLSGAADAVDAVAAEAAVGVGKAKRLALAHAIDAFLAEWAIDGFMAADAHRAAAAGSTNAVVIGAGVVVVAANIADAGWAAYIGVAIRGTIQTFAGVAHSVAADERIAVVLAIERAIGVGFAGFANIVAADVVTRRAYLTVVGAVGAGLSDLAEVVAADGVFRIKVEAIGGATQGGFADFAKTVAAFDSSIARPLRRAAKAALTRLTEGALVPDGTRDQLISRRDETATRALREDGGAQTDPAKKCGAHRKLHLFLVCGVPHNRGSYARVVRGARPCENPI
jgi:hypothetical protein